MLAPPPPPSIANVVPIATITVQSGALVSQKPTTINFDGRSSFDPNGDTLTFMWDFGDGTNSLSANPGAHKYNTPGTYLATLTVIDPYGARSSAQQLVQVLGTPPVQKPSTSSPTATTTTVAKTPSPMPTTGTSSATIAKTTPPVISYSATATPSKTKAKAATAPKKGVYQNGDLSRDIEITEVMPNPGSTGTEEWIELHNAGTEPVSLGNWMLANLTKLKKPFIIPDLVRLEPGEYMSFPKSKTKITLKNTGDTVVLADFRGTVMDSVVFEQAQKDFAYALVTNGEDVEWQWVDSPTPAAPNPDFETLQGTVTNIDGGTIQLASAGSTPHTIHFDASILDPQVASAVMMTGSQVSLQAKKNKNGDYALQKIDDVIAPVQAAAPGATKAPQSSLPWIITTLTILAAAANTRAVREKAKELLSRFNLLQQK